MYMSRHTDPTPVHCESCGWEGRVMDCEHGYEGTPLRGEDVEPMDYCPRCGNNKLIPIDTELIPA